MVKKQDNIQRASKGYIKDYYRAKRIVLDKDKTGNLSAGLLPDFDRERALKSIREDYAVQTAVSKLVDKTLENGYTFSASDGKSNLEDFERTRKRTRFDRGMRQWLYQIYGYQNAYIEIVRDGNNDIKELHTLETSYTEPVADKHGTVYGYVQVLADGTPVESSDDQHPEWDKDEVTHLKLNYMTTNVWSDIEIRSLYTSVLIKQYIMAYYGWKYGTNQLRPLYAIKDANEDSVKDFMAYWKSVQDDIEKPLVFEGEIEKTMMATATEETQLTLVINQMDENIYSVMQVPPIASNETGNSNRSSADKQEQMMAVRIKAVQSVIKEGFENDLFPKMGYPKIQINWNPVIRTDVDKMMEVAERMKNIGVKKDIIERYLIDQGFYAEKAIFDEKRYDAETSKSEDMFPSRKRKSEGDSSENIGSGEESSTREDQLVSRAFTEFSVDVSDIPKEQFNNYPYTY